MVEYFRLDSPESFRLLATNQSSASEEVILCPVTEGRDQHRTIRRGGDLSLEVKHTRRNEQLIFSWDGMVAHARLLEEFDRRGFTGYRRRPATVRFRDGDVSTDYSEVVVTGWAGVAPPESGIELIEACTGCGYKRYTGLKRPDDLIDWSQWTGDDFFIVWPLPKYTLITRRVADALTELKVKSYTIENLLTPSQPAFSMSFGLSVGALSDYFPQDLANRYGRPLGLECDPGEWPAAATRLQKAEPASPDLPDFGGWCHSAGSDEIDASIRNSRGADRQAAIAALFEPGENGRQRPSELLQQCLDLLQERVIEPDEIAPHAQLLLDIWDSAEAELRPWQQDGTSTEWLFDSDYARPRSLGEVALDVLGYVPGEDAARRLRQAVLLADPRLKTFGILSLLRRGEDVDPEQVERAAASLEMRMIFMRQLKQLGKESLMPQRWAQPEQLAASDLAHWAGHPNELGVAPEQVELMERVLVESDEPEPDIVYLFRFREYPKPWEQGEGWIAGIAGPIRNGESQDSPWSSFKPWDSLSPEQHFEKLYYRNSACAVG